MASLAMTSCNEKTEEDEPAYQPSLSVAVKSFKLNPNIRVLANLDSVFFSIDLDKGIIFNADSLPKGTNIEKLVPVITFPSTVETAEIIMEGGNFREGTVNYKTNPSDTIDFSGRVTLRLTAGQGSLSRDYTIRVNVHKAVADSLMWDHLADSSLPSRYPSPRLQKTVAYKNKAFCLIEENNGSHTLATTDDIASQQWNKVAVTLPAQADVTSLTASEDNLYILTTQGALYSSADGIAWTATGTDWVHILGGYGKCVLGISKAQDGSYLHDMYPASDGFVPTALESDFPLSGTSNVLSFSSRWADRPYAFFTGGRRGSKVMADTWAYDGNSWAKISNTPLPAMDDALIVPYFVYRKTSTSWIQTEYSVTLCLGGKLADGRLSRKVYLSYDSGVNWTEAGALMQLPDVVPSFYGADAIVQSSPMQTTIDIWANHDTPQPVGAKIHYFVDGTQVEWDCPYIYMFGGYGADGRLTPSIWRVVLARLTFSPLF